MPSTNQFKKITPALSNEICNMNNLSFFLRAPAWQVFLLSVLPVAVGMWLASLTETIAMAQMSLLFGFFVELAWIYSVSNYIAKTYSHRVEVPINRLNGALIFIIIIYILYVPGLIPEAVGSAVGFLAIGLNLYCIYFMARLVVMVEKERNVTINDYILTAISAYFWIIGIWFLQPRINQIYASNR